MMTHAHPSVSDEQPQAENPKGLSPQGASAICEAETPVPSPTPDAVAGVEEILAEWVRETKHLERTDFTGVQVGFLRDLAALLPLLQQSYKAGEEDMRERAADTVHDHSAGSYKDRMVIMRAIRALPLKD